MRATSVDRVRRRRPRSVWAALVTSVVLCLVIVVGVLLPVLGLIGGVGTTTFGAVRIPVGSITVGLVLSYLVGLGFLLLTVATRFGALAWVTAVAAIIATLVGSLWPLVATAFASVTEARDVIPLIGELIGHLTGH